MVEKWGDKNFLADFFDILLEKRINIQKEVSEKGPNPVILNTVFLRFL
jgi:hypothetical protein